MLRKLAEQIYNYDIDYEPYFQQPQHFNPYCQPSYEQPQKQPYYQQYYFDESQTPFQPFAKFEFTS